MEGTTYLTVTIKEELFKKQIQIKIWVLPYKEYINPQVSYPHAVFLKNNPEKQIN